MNKPVDFTDQEKSVLNMTAQDVGKSIFSAVVQEMRLMPDPWPKMSQLKQQDVLDRLHKCIDYHIKRAVQIIASDGRIVVAGDIEQIVIKDGAKAVVKFSKNAANLHHLYDSESNAVLVVVANASDFTVGMDEVRADPDQREFDLHDGDRTFADTSETVVIDAEIAALPFNGVFATDKATDEDGTQTDSEFLDSDWFKALKDIAAASGESIDDEDEEDTWFDLSLSMTPQEAFFDVYPEHKPANESETNIENEEQ